MILFCAPFALISLSARSGVYMLFPFLGAIPGILAVVLVFQPLESYLQSRDLPHLQDLLVPAAGALLIFVLLLALNATPTKMRALGARLTKEGRHFWGGLSRWALLGAFWGGAWRLSDWSLGYLGIGSNG